jgi:branched-chain amino acid transport system permease protein
MTSDPQAEPASGSEIELLDVSPARLTAPEQGDAVRRYKTRSMVRGGVVHRFVSYGLPVLITVLVAGSVFVLPVIEGRLVTRMVAITVILWGLDVQLGLGGQLSLGHGAFAGAGAYAAAIAMNTHHWPFPLALVAAAGVGLLAGAVVGLPSLRIQGQYLAMITLGAAVAFPYVIRRFSWFTGGTDGPRIEYAFIPPSWLGLQARHYSRWPHLIICVIALGMFFVVRSIVRGPLGRQIRAVADGPTSAAAFGIRIGWVRVYTVSLSASVAAVGGGLAFFETPAVSADSYGVFFSLSLYAAAVFGGIGTLVGSFLGALLLIAAPWAVSKFGLRMEPELIAGVVLVVFTLVARDGVVGLLRPWFRERLDVVEPEAAAATSTHQA